MKRARLPLLLSGFEITINGNGLYLSP